MQLSKELILILLLVVVTTAMAKDSLKQRKRLNYEIAKEVANNHAAAMLSPKLAPRRMVDKPRMKGVYTSL